MDALEYPTGNKGMDDKIRKALAKDPAAGVLSGGSQMPFPLNTSGEKRHKYGIRPVEERTYKDGFVFASKKEMERWDYLWHIQRAGEIEDLKRQAPFQLLPGFVTDQKEHGTIRPIHYIADFVYKNISFRKEHPGKMVIEDSKTGVRTAEYRLKKKMLLHRFADYLFFEV